jgi:hypothetical protein
MKLRGRTAMAAFLVALLPLSMALAPPAHAQTGDATLQLARMTSLQTAKATSTLALTYLVTLGSSTIYLPEYLPTCKVGTNTLAVYNTTATSQTLTDIIHGGTVGTVASRTAAVFNVTSPGFILLGLTSNPHAGVIFQCS